MTALFRHPISPRAPANISNAKLSDMEVAAIRYRADLGESIPQLAECFEVNVATMRRVVNGESYRWVE